MSITFTKWKKKCFLTCLRLIEEIIKPFIHLIPKQHRAAILLLLLIYKRLDNIEYIYYYYQ